VFELHLEQGYSVATMLAVIVVAILLVTLFYYRAFGMLERRQWLVLLALRIAAIVVVAFLLFRPMLTYHKDLEERPALVFLLDRSASMSIADDATGVPRFLQARKQIEAWWAQLKDDFQLHLIEFAEESKPLDDIAQLPAIAPDGKATSISKALRAATNPMARQDIEAIVLVSDGLHNSAQNPVEEAKRMGVVVHTVGVGASLKNDASYRDIQVTGLDCPDSLMLDNKAQIKATVEGVGLAGRVVQVVLDEDGRMVGQAELTLDDAEGSQEVQFEFRPTAKGRHTYTVKVPPAPEEKIKENNQRSTIATVVEPGIRVLYIEGTLRAEYGALVDRFLSKDPDLEFCALVQNRPNHFVRRSTVRGVEINGIPSDPETINRFDVFILGDLDSTYLKPEQQQLIVERVRGGAGLLMLGGYHSLGPGGYAGLPIGEILPVAAGGREVGQVPDSFLPMLTPEGVRHPIFANIASFFPTPTGEAKIAGLPPLDGCTRVEGARPGATVLAFCPTEVNKMPVLAVQPVDKGLAVVFTGDTTRKWQQGPRAQDQESPFLQFWGQMVRFLAGRSKAVEARASIAANTNRVHYDPEEPVQLTAVVRDAQGEGTSEARVEAKIRGPGGRPDKADLSAVPGPGGHYAASFEPSAAGPYEVVIQAKLGDLTLESEKLTFEVGRPNLEYEKLDLNERLLTQIATLTGGRYVHVTTASHLADQLDRTARKKRLFTERALFSPSLFWLIFVVAITTEWILRKRFQLR
jgi:uncharacterized membrane protein